jgi:hypothetical protein
MLPNGEKRIGIEGVSIALGYTERWFYNRTKRASKWLKGLQSTGFNGAQKDLSVIRRVDGQLVRGASVAKSITIRDFVKVVAFEAITERNLKALVLLAAFAETGVENVFDLAFQGRSLDFLLEKIVHFTKWTQEEWESALLSNREDVRALYDWGFPTPLDGKCVDNLDSDDLHLMSGGSHSLQRSAFFIAYIFALYRGAIRV